jgi:hypothetical protein
MAHATHYKEILDIHYIDCNACKIKGWTDPLPGSEEQEAKAKLQRFDSIYSLIHNAKLLSKLMEGQGGS